MDPLLVKGEHLEIETVNGEVFYGIFFSQSKDKKKLTLSEVICLPKGNAIKSLIHFYDNEIKSLRRVDKSLNGFKELAAQFDTLKLSEEEVQNFEMMSKKYIFINQTDNTFYEAMDDLKQYSTVAAGTDGAEMGRKCKLPVLSLATPKQIYIFDIQAMQDNAFDSGIRNLLESTAIKKIIHDCRKLSDCLFHKHRVQLKNVFDIQVADAIVYKNNCGRFPTKVRTLQECLSNHLGFPDKPDNAKVDIVELANRPVSTEIKEYIANNAVYLHALSTTIEEELMAPFTKGVTYFLDCQRQSNDSDAWYISSQNKQLPKAFQDAVNLK